MTTPQLQLSTQLQDTLSDRSRYDAMTKRLLWKLDLHVLPLLIVLWVACFTDRSNISNAKIAGLDRDIHLTGDQFNVSLIVFYVPFILIEIPSNLLLKKLQANRMLPLIMLLWGLVTCFTGFVQSYSGLLTTRFFLGLCEGGLFPGVVLYLMTLYKPQELQKRIAVYFASASLSGAFGGLLASFILKMDGVGGLAGWRWLFILEGLVTALLAVITWVFLPADGATAWFLTSEEREFAGTLRVKDDAQFIRLSESQPGSECARKDKDSDKASQTEVVQLSVQEIEHFEWREVIRGLTDVQTIYYSRSQGLGYSGSEAQLRTSPPFAPAAALTIFIAFLSDRMRIRGPFFLLSLTIAIAGYTIAIVAKDNSQRYAALFLIASGSWSSVPTALAMIPNNVLGHYKRAAASALVLSVSYFGAFIATFIYTPDQAPGYVRGHTIAVSFLAAGWLVMTGNMLYCVMENKARASGRRQANITKYEALWNAGKTRASIGDRHPDFRFTL
ncbi:hypothetical protein EIP91_003514 [Steccherinum ochraceum]|uniref:Major facilitator superfamily (MFS) profile domain-containing protein n=1 Tax=Steccherinum ochraceum TaxID=92696 RepID=A0A4R0RSY3_9APHY|nr:hypothetical protein EIP91_003514 [Steccherinum ochraceum]